MKNLSNNSFYFCLVFILVVLFSCKKENSLPILKTSAISDVAQTMAVSGGEITDDKGLTILTRGICWSTNITPMVSGNKTTDGAGAGSFTSLISGLTANTTYYYRAYATNSSGTGYGMVLSFKTLNYGSVTDIDANVYKTINIGPKTWMAENLKTTRYTDASSISLIEDRIQWANNTTEAFCWYNNDPTNNKSTYGALYNWNAVYTGKLCPVGWHVPSDEEWTALSDYLGGEAVAGDLLKESGSTHWTSPNTGATNGSGFTALPGGVRRNPYYFTYLGDIAYFWSSTEANPDGSRYRSVYYNYSSLGIGTLSKNSALSVRCVKD